MKHCPIIGQEGETVRGLRVEFLRTWSADLAYILGFIAGDGWIGRSKRGTGCINVYSTDKDVVEWIRDKVYPTSRIFGFKQNTKCKICYRFMLAREDAYQLLKFYRVKHKSFWKSIPEKFIGHAVRGFFDADGSVYLSTDGSIISEFAQKDKSYLLELGEVLNIRGIKTGKLYAGKEVFRLIIGRKASQKLAEFMYKDYGFCLERKKVRFRLCVQ